MNSFNSLLLQRQSVRKYAPELLTAEEVHLLLSAALRAPSSKNLKPWEFIVIEEKEKLEQLSLTKETGAKFVKEAALAIVVLGNPHVSDVWIEDASIASISVQLQAEDLGLGSCWIQIRERYTEQGYPSEEFVRELLSIPMNLNILSIISIGRKRNDFKPRSDEKELNWEKVHVGSYKSYEIAEES